VNRAARAALKEAHPKLAVGWGVSVQDFQAEAGAEHVLKDSRHPCDEVFL
jgi:beta-glucosidase